MWRSVALVSVSVGGVLLVLTSLTLGGAGPLADDVTLAVMGPAIVSLETARAVLIVGAGVGFGVALLALAWGLSRNRPLPLSLLGLLTGLVGLAVALSGTAIGARVMASQPATAVVGDSSGHRVVLRQEGGTREPGDGLVGILVQSDLVTWRRAAGLTASGVGSLVGCTLTNPGDNVVTVTCGEYSQTIDLDEEG